MAEVGKRDDGAPAHAQHLAQHFERSPGFLQRLAENHVVEGLIGQIRQGFFDVAVENRNAARDRLLDFCAGDLDPARIHVLVLGEPLQQFPLAAAEVENPRIPLDDLADDGVVATARAAS